MQNCENSLRKLEAEIRESILNYTQMIKVCELNNLKCSNMLDRCMIINNSSNDHLRWKASLFESEYYKLNKSYTQCSERLTTCEESCQLYSFLYSRKCFKVMQGNIELICQPIFVM